MKRTWDQGCSYYITYEKDPGRGLGLRGGSQWSYMILDLLVSRQPQQDDPLPGCTFAQLGWLRSDQPTDCYCIIPWWVQPPVCSRGKSLRKAVQEIHLQAPKYFREPASSLLGFTEHLKLDLNGINHAAYENQRRKKPWPFASALCFQGWWGWYCVCSGLDWIFL